MTNGFGYLVSNILSVSNCEISW